MEKRSVKNRKRRRLSGRGIFTLVLLFVALVLLIALLRACAANISFRKAVLVGDSVQSGGTVVEYARFGSYVLRYSRDGVALLSEDGKERWNSGYSFAGPRVKIQGSYGIIGDVGGYQAYIFNKDGISGTISLSSPLLNMTVSAKGTAALALEEDQACRIQFYDKKGNMLDISATLEMSVSGYPLDLALSPDGNGLLVSASTAVAGALSSQLVFYNFGVGKTNANRLVGYFSYGDSLFPDVKYLSDTSAVAIGDDRMLFFSLEQENMPTVEKEIPFETKVSAVDVGQKNTAVILPALSGGGLKISAYTSGGREQFTAELDSSCRYLEAGDDYVLVMTDEGLRIFDYKGKLRFSGELEKSGLQVFSMGGTTLVQPEGGHIYRYRLE